MEWKNRNYMLSNHNPPKPVTSKTVSKQTKMVAVLLDGKKIKSRKEYLMAIGVPEDKASLKGYNSSLFQTLKTNEIISFNKSEGCYEKGMRFKEYVSYSISYIQDKNLTKEHNKLLKKFLRYQSNFFDFIMDE